MRKPTWLWATLLVMVGVVTVGLLIVQEWATAASGCVGLIAGALVSRDRKRR
jgi:hypothetical protein